MHSVRLPHFFVIGLVVIVSLFTSRVSKATDACPCGPWWTPGSWSPQCHGGSCNWTCSWITKCWRTEASGAQVSPCGASTGTCTTYLVVIGYQYEGNPGCPLLPSCGDAVQCDQWRCSTMTHVFKLASCWPAGC
jgi:hypothetical protein